MRFKIKGFFFAACLMAGCVLDMDPAEMLPPGDSGTDEAVTADAPADEEGVDAPLDEADPDSAPEAEEPPDGRDGPDFYDMPDFPDFPDSPDIPDIIDVPIEEALPPGGVGKACETNDDCTPWSEIEPVCQDSFAGMYDLPGGYCTAECTGTDECGSGAVCVSLMVAYYCIKDCATTDECRTEDGYACREIPFIGGGTYCLPSSW